MKNTLRLCSQTVLALGLFITSARADFLGYYAIDNPGAGGRMYIPTGSSGPVNQGNWQIWSEGGSIVEFQRSPSDSAALASGFTLTVRVGEFYPNVGSLEINPMPLNYPNPNPVDVYTFTYDFWPTFSNNAAWYVDAEGAKPLVGQGQATFIAPRGDAGQTCGFYVMAGTNNPSTYTPSPILLIHSWEQWQATQPPPTLAIALNATNQTWTTSGNAPWFGQTNIMHDGFASAQSGAISHSQETWLETTVTGPGPLSFWWKVSSESGFDYLEFCTNSVVAARISGDIDWQLQNHSLGAGTQVLRWRHVKNDSGSFGQDRAWVDQVSFVPPTGLPVILTQPTSRTNSAGTTATFRVAAGGAQPLAYQWRKSSAKLSGATNSTLTLTNVQVADAGNYDVVITNVAGSVTSQVARLAVINVVTGRVVRVVSATNWPGASVDLPVELVAQGDENTVAFSLVFDPSLLAYQSNALGTGVLAGVQIMVNTNGASQGRIGVLLGLPSGAAFPAGLRQIAVFNFRVSAGITNATNVAVGFGSQPVAPEVGSADAEALSAQFVGGLVAVTPGLEADVSPRPNGDGRLTATDWTLVGRFVTGMETISNASEFARADCAPRSTLGDGCITATDWTQAGRYVVGLDAPHPVGGPAAKLCAPLFGEASRQPKADASGRLLRLVSGAASPGGQVTIPVELVAVGDENTLAFSVAFDPAALRYDAVTFGTALPLNAQLLLNTNGVGSGRLGVLLGLPVGAAFAAGTQQVLVVSFRTNSPAGLTETTVSFSDSPVFREVGSVGAEVLPADFVSARVTFGTIEPPALKIAKGAGDQIQLLLSGPPGAVCRVECLNALGATNWSPLSTLTLESTNAVVVNPQPGTNRARFYRAVRLP